MQRPLILIIDDMPENLMLLGNALENDFDLRIASSGALGLRLAGELRPQLILLDVMMPDMDGFEVCRQLKADPLLAGVPVIFVTALSEFEAESTGLELGAADYLTKPLNVAIARQRIHNLLEREQLRRQLEATALEAAARLASLKLQFLRNVSHELRTPLNGILGLAALGKRAADIDKAHLNFERIHGVGTQLLGLIESVLDFANAEAGALRLQPTPFDLNRVMADLVDEWGSRARDKGLAFAVEGLPCPAGNRHGDAARLVQVLGQLLSNALKFTEHGEIGLAVDASGDLVRFSIRDSGIGMSRADILAAFHPFEQVDGSLTRRFGGIGLALALVEHLVSLMGGRLQIDSTPGAGSHFAISVPLPACAAPP